jgi:hypothetical protein
MKLVLGIKNAPISTTFPNFKQIAVALSLKCNSARKEKLSDPFIYICNFLYLK